MYKIIRLAFLMLILSVAVASAAPRILPVEITALPFTITEPGVYVVTSNLTSASDGIIVQADNVTIDLQGNTLTGNGTSGWGIYNKMYSNCVVMNGTVTKFYTGLENEGGGPGPNQQVINFRALYNVNMGIILDDEGGIVRDSIASYNGGHGMQLNPRTLVQGNLASFNGMNGIYVAGISTIIRNITAHNGREGILCGSGCLINENTAYGNGNGYENISCPSTSLPCIFGLNIAP